MKTYISILRGINVGGKNLIKMSDLKEKYESLDFRNVTTYIQSGNVVFQSEEADTAALEREISKAILKHFGMNVSVFIIEQSALKYILEAHPFLNEKKGEKENLYICFMSKSVEPDLLNVITNISYLPDKFTIRENVIYLCFPDGYGQTKLNNNFWEHKLHVIATTRNLKTLTALIKIGETL